MKKFLNLDMPSVLGMGVSGPVIAFLTATLFSAFSGVFHWNDGAYAVIMLFMSGLLAVFPVVKAEYGMMLKLVTWPIATVMIFSTAWGSSTGISVGADVLSESRYAYSRSSPETETDFALAPSLSDLPDSGEVGMSHVVVSTVFPPCPPDTIVVSNETVESMVDGVAVMLPPREVPESAQEMAPKQMFRGGMFKRW